MKLSRFGEKFIAASGIQVLMNDVCAALASDQPMIMMGGGNPAVIPHMETTFRERLEQLVQTPESLNRFLSFYDPRPLHKSYVALILR